MKPPRHNESWTDDELRGAVEIYLVLLSLYRSGIDGKISNLTSFLTGPLKGRNAASLQYRLRNISAVLQDVGLPVLSQFPPAKKVGSGVAARIRKMVKSHPLLAVFEIAKPLDRGSTQPVKALDELRAQALTSLKRLRKELDSLPEAAPRIGHNNPPEPIGGAVSLPPVLNEIAGQVDTLISDLSHRKIKRSQLVRKNERLLRLTLKLGHWLGKRAEKFADAMLATLASALVIKVLNLMPLITDTVAAIWRLALGVGS